MSIIPIGSSCHISCLPLLGSTPGGLQAHRTYRIRHSCKPPGVELNTMGLITQAALKLRCVFHCCSCSRTMPGGTSFILMGEAPAPLMHRGFRIHHEGKLVHLGGYESNICDCMGVH